jgi:hypothetical protein
MNDKFQIARAHSKKSDVSNAKVVTFNGAGKVTNTETYEPERDENALRRKKEEKIELEESAQMDW